MRILDSKSETLEIECPHCKEAFEKEIEIDIYEPEIEIDIALK